MTEPESRAGPVVDGGDRACGELLLVLAAHARRLGPGTLLRLIATDPAAAIDLPAWCHLTGHEFVARSAATDGRPCYDVRLRDSAHATVPGQPWRLQPRSAVTAEPPYVLSPNRKEPT